MSQTKLNIIAAMCQNRGIGINGHLPWRLKDEYAYFNRMSSQTRDAHKQNAVIMGRKTWDSIPSSERPLANRLNVILTRNPNRLKRAIPKSVRVYDNLNEAIENAQNDCNVESIWIIGGEPIYREALTHPTAFRVYLTEIDARFECDVFFPELGDDFKLLKNHTNELNVVPMDKQKEDAVKIAMSRSKLCFIAAMSENMGIGINGNLPWRLSKEMKYFARLTKSTTDSTKRNAVLMGRKTWDSIPSKNRPLIDRLNVVLTKNADDLKSKIAKSVLVYDDLNRAIDDMIADDDVERIWIIGGESIYKIAMEHPAAYRIYLTEIQSTYDCDVYFPDFKNSFELVKDHAKESELVPMEKQEENGVTYYYRIYEKII